MAKSTKKALRKSAAKPAARSGAKPALAKSAPAKSAPAKSAPAKSAPAKSAPSAKTGPATKAAPSAKSAPSAKTGPATKAAPSAKAAPPAKAAPSAKAASSASTTAQAAPSASKAAGNAGATTTVRYGTRTDKGSPVAAYVAKLTGEQRAIADKLVSIIEACVPEAESGLKWGMPMWMSNGEMLTYFRAQKSDVRWGLAWVSGVALDDPGHLLQGTGKDGKHVKLTSVKDIDASRFTQWINTIAASRT